MRHFWCQVCDWLLTNEMAGMYYLANQKQAWVRQMPVSVTHTKLSRYLAALTSLCSPSGGICLLIHYDNTSVRIRFFRLLASILLSPSLQSLKPSGTSNELIITSRRTLREYFKG